MTDFVIAPAVPDTPVLFSGKRGDLTQLVIVNMLLTAVTVGIYRFWAKTRLRQFYWNSIAIGGNALEYTGRGTELFLGALIAVVVLFILSVIIGILQYIISLGDFRAAQLVDLAVYIVIAWLYGYAVFRARRYRLTRTLWRGIRFGQDGSPARYAWRRFGWLLLLIVSFGVVRPWYDVAMRRFEISHTRFGFSRFDYAGEGRELFRYWWPVLLPMAVMAAALAMLGVSFFAALQEQALPAGDPEAMSAALDTIAEARSSLIAYLLIFAALVGYVLLSTRYRVAALRYLFAVTSLHGVACRSQVRTPRVMLYAVISTVMTLAVLAIGLALIEPLGVFGIILFIFGLLTAGLINQVFFVFPLVRHVVDSLEASDLAALDTVVQATRDDPRFGEGILDALDFDMGVV